MSVEDALNTGVRLRKLSTYLHGDDFNRWIGALRELGARKIGSYEYEVTGRDILNLIARESDPDAAMERILEGVRAGSGPEAALALRDLYERVRGFFKPGELSVEIDGFYAVVRGHPATIEALEKEMRADQRAGGFLIMKRVYDPEARRFVVKEIALHRKPDAATIVVPRGLLPRLEKLLEKLGVRHNMAQLRFAAPDAGRITVPLRDYQVRAVREALEQIARFGAATIMAATGAGKTEMGIAVAQALNPTPEAPAVFVVPSKDLALQWYERLRQYGVPAAVVTGDRVEWPEGASVIVSTYATPYRALREIGLQRLAELQPDLKRDLKLFEKMLKEVEAAEEEAKEEEEGEEGAAEGVKERVVRALLSAKLVAFDEAHHLPARTVKLLSRVAPHAVKLGLSATPWRNDELDLVIYANAGEIAGRVTSSELIEKGYLVPAAIFMLSTGVSGRYGSYAEEKSRVLSDEERVKLAVEVAKLVPPPALILTQERKPGELVARALREAGLRAEFVHGELSSEERARIFEAVRRGEITHLVATTLADEGLDLPMLRSLVLYFPGKSATRVFQRIGRALRPHEGKPVAVVVDMVDQTRYFSEHAQARRRMYESEPLWRVIDCANLEDFKAKLEQLLSEHGIRAEERKRERERVEGELQSKGWRLIREAVAVIAPVTPDMKRPVFYKAWTFGPYEIHAYRSGETDDAVWVYKRRKAKVASAA